MHDSYTCHLLMHISILGSFHLALPLITSGYLWDDAGARLINKSGTPEEIATQLEPMRDLILRVRARLEAVSPSDFIKVQSTFSINYSFFENLREEDMPDSISQM